MPGVSVAVAVGDEIILAKGYGLAEVEHEVPATAETVYRIGSVTKLFTASAIMQLRDQGKHWREAVLEASVLRLRPILMTGLSTSLGSQSYSLGDLLDVVRDFRNQNRVRGPGYPGVQRDPTGVSTHHLYDHHAIVRFGRRVQAVDRLGGDGDRGVEAESRDRAVEVVVDGLRDSDDGQALLGEAGSCGFDGAGVL